MTRRFRSRGVAQPGRAPGSGPGGRRFKSSLPDQSFNQLQDYFSASNSNGVDFVAVKASQFNKQRLRKVPWDCNKRATDS